MVDVFAGRFAEPGVVHLHDTVVLQVAWALGDEKAENRLRVGIVNSETAFGEGFRREVELLALVRGVVAFANKGDLVEVAHHFGAHARCEPIAKAGAEEILGKAAALLGIRRAEVVQIEEMAEGDKQHRVGQQP